MRMKENHLEQGVYRSKGLRSVIEMDNFGEDLMLQIRFALVSIHIWGMYEC